MKASQRWFLAALGLAFSSWSLAGRSAGATGVIRTVALSGMHAPGTGETFGDVGYHGISLNNHGETAFIASPTFHSHELSLGSGFDPRSSIGHRDESVWTEAGGRGLRRIAQEGPGEPGDGTLVQLSRVTISDSGHTTYQSSLSSGASAFFYPTNILRNRLGEADVVVAAQESIAPSTTQAYENIYSPKVNAHGNVAFFGDLYLDVYIFGVNNFQGIWAELGGRALDLVARQGDGAPGTSGTFKDLSENLSFVSNLAIGDGGHVAYRGTFFTDRTRGAIWLANPTGELQAVVREGDAAPIAGATFRSLGPPSINGRGHIAYSSGLTPPRGSTDTGRALWRYSTATGPVLVAIQGQQAPGVDALFASNHGNYPTFRDPVLGEGGHVTFIAELLDDNVMTDSIWLGDATNALQMVARAGDRAPGTQDNFTTLGFPTVNARGQVAFSARTIDYWKNWGIWAQDRNGVLQAIVKVGDVLDVSDDPAAPDPRKVAYLSFREGGSFGLERVTGFNDLGQVAFFARFTDGTSGIFVSNAVAVPEPSSLVVLVVFALMERSRTRHLADGMGATAPSRLSKSQLKNNQRSVA